MAAYLIRRGNSVIVNAFPQGLSRLEMWHMLSGQCNRVAGLGVTTHARGPEMQAEAAKTPDFNSFAVRQGTAHLFQYGFDAQFHIEMRKVLLLVGQLID